MVGVCVAEGMCGSGPRVAGEIATATDGTHPTGMHSCSVDVGTCNLGQCQGHLYVVRLMESGGSG